MEKELADQIELIERVVGKKKGVLNTSEVAKVLGVSNSTVDGWRTGGVGIPYIKPNMKSEKDKSRVLYPVIEIAKWIIKNMVKTA